jgi:hypothetical protein
MFFKGQEFALFALFLWLGLVFGVIAMIFKTTAKIFKKNTYVINLLTFVFWTGFGLAFALMCNRFYNYSFCWFGFVGMCLGLVFIKISVQFFFDRLVRFIYNKVIIMKTKRKSRSGKLQTNKKI